MSFVPQHTVAWAEIPVGDLDAAQTFYESVFNWQMERDDTGPNPIVNFRPIEGSGISGHLYPGEPGGGITLHLIVPDSLKETRARVEDAGGKVVSPDITIPVGAFAYCTDPDGNSLGLFEMAA